MSQNIRVIQGLSEIAEEFDVFVLDLWGCMHDGVTVYPDALACAQKLRDLGKISIIMSNAPRRASEVALRIEAMGIDASLYQKLYASGEETWRALKQGNIAELDDRDRRFFPIMAARDSSLIDGLDLIPVGDPKDASFVLVSGVESAANTVAEFEGDLRAARARNLPLICANPDLMVHRGGVAEICAGAIAARYEEIGGAVVWFGKPHRRIYDAALAELGVRPERLLCIGDSLRTDIAGGSHVGAGTLLIAGGIHKDEILSDSGIDLHRLATLSRSYSTMPDFAMSYLRW